MINKLKKKTLNKNYSVLSDDVLALIKGGSLGHILKESREKANLTEKELSQRLHVSISSLSHYENNKRRPDLEFIKEFSHILNIDINSILEEL